MKTLRLRVTMRDVRPAVLRVLDVPADTTLDELHDLLQAAIGWTDSHLHKFVTDDMTYSVPGEDWEDWEDSVDEHGVRLSKLPLSFRYDYDFGDGWEHDVEVLGTGGEQPGVVAGEGSCPPEDCGGPHGYELLLKVLADPQHEEHERMAEWVGELPEFDLGACHALLRRTVGEVPASVRMLLDLIGPGVKVTGEGRLPRALVRQVQELRPEWYPFEGLATWEENLYALHCLHHQLKGAGLLRLVNGKLTPTKAAADDREIVRRLRAWFEKDDFVYVVGGTLAALVSARGPQSRADAAAAIHPFCDRRWYVGDEPITVAYLQQELSSLLGPLQACDLVSSDFKVVSAGPSATTLLVRATALAVLFEQGRA